MAASPTARSLAYAREQGWLVGVTEHWNPHARIRQDLFGFIDVVVIDGDVRAGGILAVQATTGSNASKRVQKILDTPDAETWLRAGLRIEVWSWRKLKVKRGGIAYRWELDRRPVTLDDFERRGDDSSGP
jgi:hypothetical protein